MTMVVAMKTVSVGGSLYSTTLIIEDFPLLIIFNGGLAALAGLGIPF
jgi:hypothetical protein